MVEAEVGGLVPALEAVALPAVLAHGLILVDLDVRGGGRRTVLRVFVDKPGGVTIEDCRRLSQELGDLVDVSGLIAGGYDLEVSSPGLDRELRRDREFRWAIGKLVRVWTREPISGRREFGGRLTDVGETSISVADADGSVAIPRAVVTKARLELSPGGGAWGSRESG